ncbi:MAG: hypothetical protein HRT89_21685 [Lentisphaeria bacterium]|nr:hypothetical protein [Lentisphaeria bacterium]NQZ70674.1 hypothetical protein [Lentisphaeria bacterium]
MPYDHSGKNIRKEDDKRVKLTDEDKRKIIELYPEIKSQRKLAAMFGVSRRLISMIVDPEKKEKDLQQRKERGGSMNYYDKETNSDNMKRYRQHKQKLKLKGKLEEGEEN